MASINLKNVESKLDFAQLLARVAPTAQIKLKSEAAVTQPLSTQAVGVQEQRVPHRVGTTSHPEISTGDIVGASTNASQPSTRAGSPSGSSSSLSSASSSRQRNGVTTKLQQRCCATALDDLDTDSEIEKPDSASVTPESAVASLSSRKSTPLSMPTSTDMIMGTSPAPYTQAIAIVTGDASKRIPARTPVSNQKVEKQSAHSRPLGPNLHEACSQQQQMIRNSPKSMAIDCSIMRTSPVQATGATGKQTFIDASLRSPVGSVVSSNPPALCKSSTKPTQDASRRTPDSTMRRPGLMYNLDSQLVQDASTRSPICSTCSPSSASSAALHTLRFPDSSLQRPVSTTTTSPSEACCNTDVLTSWLWGVNEPLPNGEELAQRLRAVAPEIYED